MKKQIQLLNKCILIFLIMFLALSCATTKLTKSKSGKYQYNKEDTVDVLDVSVSLLPLPAKSQKKSEKPKTFFDLRDSIPHTLLRVIGENTNSADKIIELIRQPLSKTSTSVKTKSMKKDLDLTLFKVRFLFTNIKKFYLRDDLMHDNTRLQFLNTTLNLVTDEVKIYTINKLENELETIDLGSIERTNNVTFSTKLTGNYGVKATNSNEISQESNQNTENNNSDIKNVYDEFGNVVGSMNTSGVIKSNSGKSTINKSGKESSAGANAELAYTNAESIKESLQLKRNSLKTGFSFNPKKITVAQRGRPMNGIVDNVILTATLKFKNTRESKIDYFSNLFNNYAPNKPKKNKN